MIRRIAFASFFFAAPFLAHAQTSGTCTAATLSGTYSLTLTGRTVTSAVALTADYQAVGTITFDGVSKATATLVSNSNKAQGVAQTLAGTYTIPSNCVGTLNITGGDTATYTLIPYNSGNNYLITGSDAAYILTGSGGPQPASCLTSTLSGVFAFSGNGFSLVSGGITAANDISGLLQFDGAGAVSWQLGGRDERDVDAWHGQRDLYRFPRLLHRKRSSEGREWRRLHAVLRDDDRGGLRFRHRRRVGNGDVHQHRARHLRQSGTRRGQRRWRFGRHARGQPVQYLRIRFFHHQRAGDHRDLAHHAGQRKRDR